MSKLVELRPDPVLMDHSFEGYKLNLQSLPYWFKDLNVPVDRVFPSEAQYSFVHAKLFGLHNHLVPDNWDTGLTHYYIDKNQQVCRIGFESLTHTFDFAIVYDIPAHVSRISGHFNLCLSFPSNKLAVISDGTGYLHIVSTGVRNSENSLWKTLQSFLVLDGECFVILDSRVHERDENVTVHVLCQSVEHIDDSFYSVLTWVAYEIQGQTWKMKNMKKLRGKGAVHYAAIETSFESVYVASDHPFKYILDTEKEIVEESPKINSKEIIYTWTQTSEDISITLQLEENYDKSLLEIDVKTQSIKVSYKEKAYIEGNLYDKVDADLTTWNVEENGVVNILITKLGSENWNELIAGDETGEYIPDPALVELAHRRLAHLCAETEVTSHEHSALGADRLEECDVTEQDSVLARYSAQTHKQTHHISLTNNSFLFSITTNARDTPAVALRHDVDACVWQPSPGGSDWIWQHCVTLPAFGYVQSSKTNRKFVTSTPDGSYSVVCESNRHIFIYKPGAPTLLRNRRAANMRDVKIGQQYVLNLDAQAEVLGVSAPGVCLFVITANAVWCVEL